jgi:hypothetical protein
VRHFFVSEKLEIEEEGQTIKINTNMGACAKVHIFGKYNSLLIVICSLVELIEKSSSLIFSLLCNSNATTVDIAAYSHFSQISDVNRMVDTAAILPYRTVAKTRKKVE